jgi:hypothetical protein
MELITHTFPWGKSQLIEPSELCKCGKYLKLHTTCMRCEPAKKPLDKPVKKSNKK